MYPLSLSRSVVLDAKEHSTSTVDQHAMQIDILAFTHAEQLLFPSSGILPRHNPNPSREVASPAKRCPITNGGHSGSGDQRPKAGNLAESPAALILATMRSISSVTFSMSISVCFHSCHSRFSSQRR